MSLELRESLFWDFDITSIDYEKHKTFVIERVSTHGLWKEFNSIVAFYGESVITDVLKNARYLDKKTLSYISARFNVPQSDFRCYKLAQLNQEHWNY